MLSGLDEPIDKPGGMDYVGGAVMTAYCVARGRYVLACQGCFPPTQVSSQVYDYKEV
jgi:hypothetical protein